MYESNNFYVYIVCWKIMKYKKKYSTICRKFVKWLKLSCNLKSEKETCNCTKLIKLILTGVPDKSKLCI